MTTDARHELRRAVQRALAWHAPGDRILIGVSGGADSLALALTAAEGAPAAGITVAAAVIDHGLQPGSAHVAEQAGTMCRMLGLDPVYVSRVDVDLSPGSGGLEHAARQARRARLQELADACGAAAIWLAHTVDDQAETVLLGLLRGSGARSLAGMRERDGRWERPLLAVTRATTRAAVTAVGLDAFDDPHNADHRFARVRVRETVLPVMEQALGGHIRDNLVRSADLLRDDADALDALAGDWLATHDNLLIADLRALPRAVRTRVLRLAMLARGATANDLHKEHIDAVDHLVTEPRTVGPVRLPGPIEAHKRKAAGVIEFH